ncbi:nitroreductase family protein [Streptomyces kronopolitis]|uniref:nitroreductase family protein n=1 Tax=Streptomyces kronopolitis TaxID=1612435 RepID=UPI0035711348
MDTGAYLQTLLLAMTAYGVVSCPQGLLSFYADTVRDELRVDEGKLLVGISFGYADENAPVNQVATDRAALEATTTFHS